MVLFPIRFTGINRAMAVLGLTPANSWVKVSPTEVVVRLGWAFRATIARSSVSSATDDHGSVWGWGVHGWRGIWLVNGSSSGLLRLELDPPAQARVLGLPVALRVLRVSVEDPKGLCDALEPPGSAGHPPRTQGPVPDG